MENLPAFPLIAAMRREKSTNQRRRRESPISHSEMTNKHAVPLQTPK